MDYDAQCTLKQEQIKQLYEKDKMIVHPVNKADNPREYRNKCIYTFQKVKKQIKFGFYEENSHYVIDIKNCLNHDELTMKILNEIKKLIIDFKLEVYDEDNFTGIFRHD
jgi:23S rRNA (uracil1939-C5)-methyltransferase